MTNYNPKANPKSVVSGKNYRFTVLTNRLIRLEWSDDGVFEDRATRAVVNRYLPPVDFSVKETESSLEIITDSLHLYYDKKPFTTGGLSIGLKGMIKHKCSKWHYHMPDIIIHNERINLKGTCKTLDSIDGPAELDDGLLDRHGFSTFEDTDTMVWDGKRYIPRPLKKNEVDLYFFGYLENHRDCIRDFHKISGAVPMVPRYALGNWWSRYYEYTEQTYSALLDKFREKKIPLSVAVLDMDWHITNPDSKYGNGWTGYTWNRKFFPDPKRFMKFLHDSSLKTTLNLHPCDGIRAFEDCYESVAKAYGTDPASENCIEFDVSDDKFMNIYLEKVLKPLEEDGVDFWWIDWQQYDGTSKDGYDPLWELNWRLYDFDKRKKEYPLILSRYAGLGSHRYPVGFSGDTVMTWESLDYQPYFTSTASNVGYTWWSHDIGGHTRGIWDDELQIRWFEYGVFSPIFRPHSGKKDFFLKEPWNFPVQTEQILTSNMRLRHALVPYIYTMDYLNHVNGDPLCSPLYYDYPKQMTNEKDYLNEYMFGTNLLVCPITTKCNNESMTAKVRAWIPQGTWFDIFTNRRYTGEKVLDLYRTTESIPVLAKAGTVLPLNANDTENGTDNPVSLKLKVFAGANGSFAMYEDNGLEDGNRSAVTVFDFRWGKNALLTINPVSGDASVVPAERNYEVEFIGINKINTIKVFVNGKQTEFDGCLKNVKSTDKVEFCVDCDALLLENRWVEEIVSRLPRFQIGNVEKEKLLLAVRAAKSRVAAAGSLVSLCSNDYVAGEILEILTCAE